MFCFLIINTYINRNIPYLDRKIVVKTRKKDEKDVDFPRDEAVSENSDILKSLYEELKADHNVSLFDLFKQLEDDTLIPVSIFNKELAALETICKYLKENLGFNNKKIASLTGRTSKDVWQAYNSAKNKLPKKFDVKPSRYFIPVSILKNKELSVLENIVVCLKEKFGLSYHEIAVLLKRDDRTIWTVYQNSLKKNVKR